MEGWGGVVVEFLGDHGSKGLGGEGREGGGGEGGHGLVWKEGEEGRETGE